MCEECGKKCAVGIFKIRKTEEIRRERTFSCKVNKFLAAPCLLSVGVFADDLKNLNWPQAMLQTKRWRSTLRSSCTSRFTRRFPPRWLKSRWNHSSCSDNSHTQTNTNLGTNTHRQTHALFLSLRNMYNMYQHWLTQTEDIQTQTRRPKKATQIGW